MKIYKDIFNQEQKDFLEDIFKNEKTPFYLATHAVHANDQAHHFVHHVIHRDRPNEDNSTLTPPLKKLLYDISDKINLNLECIYRCALNITFNFGLVNKCLSHVDHPFAHRQVLIYLNDSDGDTVFLNEDNTETKIKPEAYKIIVAKDTQHYQFFPTKGIRKVLIYTINV